MFPFPEVKIDHFPTKPHQTSFYRTELPRCDFLIYLYEYNSFPCLMAKV